MEMEISIDQKVHLIIRDLQEVIGSIDGIKQIVEKRRFKIYWGTAPTGKIHIGYFIPLMKIADFINADCDVQILIADLHAFLDCNKSDLDVVEFRTEYYIAMIKSVLTFLNVDTTKIKFVKGTSFQLQSDYTMDMYRFNQLHLSQAKRAGAEVVKQSTDPIMTSLLYPSLQALDEVYLDVDAQFGGIDQRKIFMYAREHLDKLASKKDPPNRRYNKRRFHLMNPMIPGIRFEKEIKTYEEKETDNTIVNKMSSSTENSKIDLLDTTSDIKNKINKVYCLPGDVDDNTLLTLFEKLISKLLIWKNKKFMINRKEQHGGPIVYEIKDFDKIREDYKNEQLHPADFKLGIIDTINSFLSEIQTTFYSMVDKKLVSKAYPNKKNT